MCEDVPSLSVISGLPAAARPWLAVLACIQRTEGINFNISTAGRPCHPSSSCWLDRRAPLAHALAVGGSGSLSASLASAIRRVPEPLQVQFWMLLPSGVSGGTHAAQLTCKWAFLAVANQEARCSVPGVAGQLRPSARCLRPTWLRRAPLRSATSATGGSMNTAGVQEPAWQRPLRSVAASELQRCDRSGAVRSTPPQPRAHATGPSP